jgi:hypothetical protein
MNIRKKFEEIVRVYFPKWKNWKSWKVRRTNGVSECKPSSQTIVFNQYELLEEKDKVDLLFIHEITHAVTQDYHNRKFLNRLKKAKTTAFKLHRSELENLIEKEIEMVSNSEKFTDYLKERIPDIVTIDAPDISWKELVEAISAENRCKPKDVTKYKFTRKLFDQAKKQVEFERKTREKFGFPPLV